MQSLIRQIEDRIASNADLVIKLHDIIAGTLGADLNAALSVPFDLQISETSLRFFNVADIPAIHGSLQARVSDLRFRSDLSAVTTQSVQSLIDQDPVFWDLLPRKDDG